MDKDEIIGIALMFVGFLLGIGDITLGTNVVLYSYKQPAMSPSGPAFVLNFTLDQFIGIVLVLFGIWLARGKTR